MYSTAQSNLCLPLWHTSAHTEHLVHYPKKASKVALAHNNRGQHKRSIDLVDSSQYECLNSSKNGKTDISQRLINTSMCQSKSKRVRTIFTPDQLEKLETEFERQQYMVGPERLYLASALNLSEAQVKVWFQVMIAHHLSTRNAEC